jgi:hypothetical protein
VREHGDLIHSEIYAGRIESRELLLAASTGERENAHELRRAASELDSASARFTDSKVGVPFAAYADLIRIVALLVEWRRATLDAESDADRFKRGWLGRLAMWQSDYGSRPECADVVVVAGTISDAITIQEIEALCRRLAQVALPIGMFGDAPKGPKLEGPFAEHQREREAPPELNVAFLSFTVDGEPADQLNFLTPREMHDLEIEVRVSRWPENATELRLSAISIEVPGAYAFPQFRFERPTGAAPPFVLRERGRAIIHAAQALRAQPFEFRYAAEFSPKSAEQPVSVVGHRTLRIESVDFHNSSLTGYPAVDRKLLEIRNNLRRLPAMPRADLDVAMLFLVPLASLAARAVQDDLYPNRIGEAEFQSGVRDELRRSPPIGGELEEHAHAAGGETDLSLRGLRLELKVEPTRRLTLPDCQQFIEQTAAYAVGSGKRLGVLCVLDVSPKDQAAFPAEEGIGVLHAASGVPVVAILIQGGLARPSDLSKQSQGQRKRKKNQGLAG